MGYRIVYAGPASEQKTKSGSGIRFRSFVAAAFLIFSIFVRLLWPEGTSMLRTVFLPGDLSVTEQAFSELIADLRDGQPVGESVTAFCHRVIDEAS